MSVLASTAGPSAYWYLARGTGAVALVLLTISVVLGILGSLRFSPGPRWPRFAIDALHRDVSLLVMVLLVIHIVTSVLDGFAPISLADAVIPFRTAYRSLWMGLGALSFDLLIALMVTSLARRRLGYRSWRAIHWLAYASWPVAVLHGLGTGTDTKAGWMLGLTIGCLVAVFVAALIRIARADARYAGVRAPAAALAIATPVGLAAFTLAGPLRPGWAKRAGTPASLLAHAPVPVSASGSAPKRTLSPAPAAGTLASQFSAALNGTVTQSIEPGGAVVELSMQLSGDISGQLRIRLGGSPLEGGGLSMTGSQVNLSAVGEPSVLQGQIVSLQGEQFLARVRDSAGTVVDLRGNMNVNSGAGSVSGSLTGNAVQGGR